MNCDDIRPLLSAYYDGEVTPEEQNQVEKHMATCEDCRHVMAEYRAIGGGIRALPVPIPPTGLRRDVWRAIETAQPRRASAGKVTTLDQKRRERALPGPLTTIGRGWGKALPAGAVLAAMLLIFVVAMLIRGATPVGAAELTDPTPIANYNQTLHIKFNKPVIKDDVEKYTSVLIIEGGVSQPVTSGITPDYNANTHELVININSTTLWKPGASYEIYIDAPNIRTGVADGRLQNDPIRLGFSTVAYTPTPTRTSIPTRTPSPTPPPTHTPEPTAIAQSTPSVEPSASPTATSTREPETATPTTTSTRIPEPSSTPTVTPTASRKGTATPTPPRGTPTPTPPCTTMPVNGFGKLWRENAHVRVGLGCPTASELPIQQAAEQHFLGGYMFWRGDTGAIYVFLGTSDNGKWYQYEDTWREGEPTPVPVQTPPAGLYVPVRGFGKIWRSEPGLRQALGWATDQETAITAAWQPFTSGSALWTSNHVIRTLYDNDTWESYPDTFVWPTSTPHGPPVTKP